MCPLPDLGTGDPRALLPRRTGTKQKTAAERAGRRQRDPLCQGQKTTCPGIYVGKGWPRAPRRAVGGCPAWGDPQTQARKVPRSHATPHRGGQLPTGRVPIAQARILSQPGATGETGKEGERKEVAKKGGRLKRGGRQEKGWERDRKLKAKERWRLPKGGRSKRGKSLK